MITSGVASFGSGYSGKLKNSTRKTEVVDVLSGKNCADLADFPFSNKGAVAANLQGTPVVCGGWSKRCYKFINDGWQKFASMNEKRNWAAGIVHKNKFHVFGGSHQGILKVRFSIVF